MDLRTLDLSHLSFEERERVLFVLQKDQQLRQQEELRVIRMRHDVRQYRKWSKLNAVTSGHCFSQCLRSFRSSLAGRQCRICCTFVCEQCAVNLTNTSDPARTPTLLTASPKRTRRPKSSNSSSPESDTVSLASTNTVSSVNSPVVDLTYTSFGDPARDLPLNTVDSPLGHWVCTGCDKLINDQNLALATKVDFGGATSDLDSQLKLHDHKMHHQQYHHRQVGAGGERTSSFLAKFKNPYNQFDNDLNSDHGVQLTSSSPTVMITHSSTPPTPPTIIKTQPAPTTTSTDRTLTSVEDTRSNSSTNSNPPFSPFRFSSTINRHRELPIIEPLLNLTDLNLITSHHHQFGNHNLSYVQRFKELTGSDRASTGGSSTGDLLWEHEMIGSTDELTGPHVRELEWDDFESDDFIERDGCNQKSNSDPELNQQRN